MIRAEYTKCCNLPSGSVYEQTIESLFNSNEAGKVIPGCPLNVRAEESAMRRSAPVIFTSTHFPFRFSDSRLSLKGRTIWAKVVAEKIKKTRNKMLLIF